MAFVKVKLLVGEKTYSVEVDENANAQALAQGFVERLRLPKNKQYLLHLVGALKIHEGATLTLVEVQPQDLYKDFKEDSGH
jgi:hypothetical protein